MLHTIAQRFTQKSEVIENFIKEKSQGLIPPLYLSCDIRNSGKKLGIIDSNLFPAGFNNLCNAYSRRTAVALKNYFLTYFPTVKKVILLSEEHTRNRFYLENVHRLLGLLNSIGLEVRAAYPGQEIQEDNIKVVLNNEETLPLGKLKTEHGEPQVGDFKADLVISNNDFSQQFPKNLEPIIDKIIPTPQLGWHRRRKSHHFSLLQELINELATLLDLDPWLLSCIFSSSQVDDLSQNGSLNLLADTVEEVLKKIRLKYEEYQINDPPYVFLKNDAGTYGMGLLDVSDPEEIRKMNRRTRNKLQSAKGGGKASSFLIQEGIPTADFYSDLPIEPVIYMVGMDPVGGFFRMNPEKDHLSSLNTRGMIFSCLCLHKIDEPHEENFLNCPEKENLVRLSTVMARIATLAAAREMQAVQNFAVPA